MQGYFWYSLPPFFLLCFFSNSLQLHHHHPNSPAHLHRNNLLYSNQILLSKTSFSSNFPSPITTIFFLLFLCFTIENYFSYGADPISINQMGSQKDPIWSTNVNPRSGVYRLRKNHRSWRSIAKPSFPTNGVRKPNPTHQSPIISLSLKPNNNSNIVYLN